MSSPFFIITLIFILLKLDNEVSWSWWWVFSPIFLQWFAQLCVFIWWESKSTQEKLMYIRDKYYD